MTTLLKADIFFFITSSAVVGVALVITIVKMRTFEKVGALGVSRPLCATQYIPENRWLAAIHTFGMALLSGGSLPAIIYIYFLREPQLMYLVIILIL